jgi:hypothetical protein
MHKMASERHSNVIGFDDAPFPPHHKGKVKVVGAVFAGLRFDGLLIGEVEKDGFDAADALFTLITDSKFAEHVRLVMLQGVAFGGFNVVDVFALHERLKLPILIVARHEPDFTSIRRALLERDIPEGVRKWAVIERLGPMERAGDVCIQRVGLSYEQAHRVLERFSIYGHIPEPLRVAHLIASALTLGESRGRA